MNTRMWLVALLVITGVSAAMADGEKVTLTPKYKPGQYLATVQMQSKQTMLVGGQEMATDMAQTMELSYDVGQPDDAGDIAVTMKFKRFAQSVKMPMGEMAFDTAKPDEGNQEMGKALLPLTKAVIKMKIGPDGKVKDVSGLSDMWDKMESIPEANRAQMKASLGDDMIRGMMNQQTAMLPSKPIAVGESWKADQEMAVPMLGKMKPDMTFTLKEVKDTPAGKVATISTAGKIDAADQKVEMGGATMSFKKMNMEIKGESSVNVDSIMESEGTSAVAGQMEMEVGPDDAKQQLSAKFNVTTVMRSKRVEPAAE